MLRLTSEALCRVEALRCVSNKTTRKLSSCDLREHRQTELYKTGNQSVDNKIKTVSICATKKEHRPEHEHTDRFKTSDGSDTGIERFCILRHNGAILYLVWCGM